MTDATFQKWVSLGLRFLLTRFACADADKPERDAILRGLEPASRAKATATPTAAVEPAEESETDEPVVLSVTYTPTPEGPLPTMRDGTTSGTPLTR